MELHFRQFGKGPALVILHGLFGSCANWQMQAANLGKYFSVYVPDLRNHGLSPHAATMRLHEMIDDVSCFFAARNIHTAAVIGHSLGGTLAMKFALENPGKVKKLIVVDMAPKPYPLSHDVLIEYLYRLDLAKFDSYRELDESLADVIADDAQRYLILHNIERGRDRLFRWRINLSAIRDGYASLCNTQFFGKIFPKPALFICGAASDFITSEDIQQIRALFPLSEIKPVQGAGHWVHAQTPKRFLEIAGRFLSAKA